MITKRQFWIRTIAYVMVTVFISTAISEEFFRFQLGNFKIDDMAVEYKIGYAVLKIGIAWAYLRSIQFDLLNIVAIIILALLIRYFAGPYTMGIAGPAIALYLKDSLIHTRNS